MVEDNTITTTYLDSQNDRLNDLLEFFRSLAKRFYPKSSAGLLVTNNEGENQIRYSIDARIESDSSDGINNVKIFCFDQPLLFRGGNHSVKFIFHDSRLFDGVDSRQISELLRTVEVLFAESGQQYIATLNQNQLDEVQNVLGEGDFERLVSKNVVLQLDDGDDSGKLLGITVEL